MDTDILAIVAAVLLALVALLQTALAAGAPLGRFAWGGQTDVLSLRQRWASLASVPALALFGWVIFARAGMLPPGSDAAPIRLAIWVLAGFFALNTLANLASRSTAERLVMTPATIIMTACCVGLALWG